MHRWFRAKNRSTSKGSRTSRCDLDESSDVIVSSSNIIYSLFWATFVWLLWKRCVRFVWSKNEEIEEGIFHFYNFHLFLDSKFHSFKKKIQKFQSFFLTLKLTNLSI